MNRDHEFSVGDVVLDSHQESPNPAVVVNLPPRRADEWTVYTNTTVAEDNPDYPDESPVIIVAFYDNLSERAEELLWPKSPIPLTELHDYDVKDYAFPPNRLERADDTSLPARHSGDGRETTTESNGEVETTSDADERDDGDNTSESSEMSSTEDDGGEQDLHELETISKTTASGPKSMMRQSSSRSSGRPTDCPRTRYSKGTVPIKTVSNNSSTKLQCNYYTPSRIQHGFYRD